MSKTIAAALAALISLTIACGPSVASDAALEEARDLATCGKLDQAQERLAALDAAHPTDARVALLAGEVATWRGYADEGLAWMRRASERAPEDPDAHLRAAYVLLVHPPDGEPDSDAALSEASAALADAGGVESADYRACRGEAAWVRGEIADAEAWFRTALELRPDCRWALQRLLQIVSAQGDEGEPERQALNERLSELLRSGRSGSGMENARMPVSFCGH
jgi:tetratricopeptide (TPR) repeat protein